MDCNLVVIMQRGNLIFNNLDVHGNLKFQCVLGFSANHGSGIERNLI